MKFCLFLSLLLTVSSYGQTVNAHWDFHETSGSTIGDVSGNGYDAAAIATPPIIYASSGSLYGRDFNGSTQYAPVPNASCNLAGDFSIALTMQTALVDGPGSGAIPFSCASTSPLSGYSWSLAIGATSNNVIEFSNGLGSFFPGSTSVSDGAWHDIVVVLTGTTLTVYVDGVLDKTTTGVAHPVSHTGNGAIGAYASGTFTTFAGEIGDVQIWSTGLTAGQVATLNSARLAHRTALNPVRSTPAVPFGQPFVTQPVNGLAQTPPCGWQSWYFSFLGQRVTEAQVRAQAAAMISTGMLARGCKYIWIAEPGTVGRDIDGYFISHRFPNIAQLVSDLIALGFVVEYYTAAGKHTCLGYLGSYGWETVDTAWMKSVLLGAAEFDWCSAQVDYAAQIGTLGQSDAMRYVYEYINTQMTAASWAPLYGLLENYSVVPAWARFVGANYFRWTDDTEGTYTGADADFDAPDVSTYAVPGTWPLADISPVGNPQIVGSPTCVEGKTIFAIWAIFGSTVQISADLENASACTLATFSNSEVLAVLNDPTGGGKKILTNAGCAGCEVWIRQMAGANTWALCLLNRSGSTATVSATWSAVHAALSAFADMSYSNARDLENHVDLGAQSTGYSASVVSHGVSFIKLSNPGIGGVVIGGAVSVSGRVLVQ